MTGVKNEDHETEDLDDDQIEERIRESVLEMTEKDARSFLKDALRMGKAIILSPNGRRYYSGDVDKMRLKLVRRLVTHLLLKYAGFPVGEVLIR